MKRLLFALFVATAGFGWMTLELSRIERAKKARDFSYWAFAACLLLLLLGLLIFAVGAWRTRWGF